MMRELLNTSIAIPAIVLIAGLLAGAVVEALTRLAAKDDEP